MRGPLVTMVQLLISVGLCVGFFCCYGTAPIPSSLSWRLPFALQSGIAVALAIAAHIYLPHSPRWLAYKGRKEEASRVWDKLGVSDAEREKDILQNPTLNDATPLTEGIALPSESTATPQTTLKLSFKARLSLAMDRLRNSFGQDTRKPLVLGIFLMSMQQLSGIDGVIYVSRICVSACVMFLCWETFILCFFYLILYFGCFIFEEGHLLPVLPSSALSQPT